MDLAPPPWAAPVYGLEVELDPAPAPAVRYVALPAIDATLLRMSRRNRPDNLVMSIRAVSGSVRMSEEIEASVALMKSQGIVDSGEAQARGIGAMSAARIEDFYAQMVKAGLYKPGEVDLSKVATLQFVNKKVGDDVLAKLRAK